MIKVILKEIQKTILKENEYIIFKFSEDSISVEDAHEMAKSIRKGYPGIANRCILLVGDFEIQVVSKESNT